MADAFVISSSWSISDVVDDAFDIVGLVVFGSLSTTKNEIAWISGTKSISNNVDFGVNPMLINPAYVKAPPTPAAPVPDDHVEITFLNENQFNAKLFNFEIMNFKRIYLLNFGEYARSDVSPAKLSKIQNLIFEKIS